MFSRPFCVFQLCSDDAFNGEKKHTGTEGCQPYKEVTCLGPLTVNEDHIYTVSET